jgi:hypothetical protein
MERARNQIQIEIDQEKWKKFNPRSDRANYTWFRFENVFFHDQSMFGLSAEDKLAYVFVLCEMSKKNIPKINIDIEYASAMLRVTQDEFIQSVISLEKSKLIKSDLAVITPSSRRRKAVIKPTILPATIRDDTYETNERSSSPPKLATPVSEVRDSFLESYKQEFKRDYAGWGAKENGMVSKWLKSVSLESAKRLCELYPKWNDPWVTKQGHPLGILMAQYVQLDAWAQNPKQLISKIAAGKAAENVDLKRAVDFEEMKRGLKHTATKQQAIEDLSATRRVQKPIQITATKGILGERRDPFGAEVFDPPSESNFGESV